MVGPFYKHYLSDGISVPLSFAQGTKFTWFRNKETNFMGIFGVLDLNLIQDLNPKRLSLPSFLHFSNSINSINANSYSAI